MQDVGQRPRPIELTTLEMQVLKGVVEGRLTKQIAADLDTSEWRVHRARMLLADKIGSRDRDAWRQAAVRFGLVQP